MKPSALQLRFRTTAIILKSNEKSKSGRNLRQIMSCFDFSKLHFLMISAAVGIIRVKYRLIDQATYQQAGH